ncbi:hypothetical protein C8Q80DRAFT_597582 [Daedaleopsis nitida]|nr:hypothetical protein C8Q80DRAFT_597582 [Daedaleopsis nitida]
MRQSNTQPLRLRKEIPTFPLFRLSELSDLVSTLGLSNQAYVDAYNLQARTWEQEDICAVHSVESGQRMLYRIRRNLIQGLEDNECPGLDSELELQHRSTRDPGAGLDTKNAQSRKRRAEDRMCSPLSKYHKSSPSSSTQSLLYSSASVCSETRSTSSLFLDNEMAGAESGGLMDPTMITPPSSSASLVDSPASFEQPLPTATSQPTQEYMYTPHTPISPVHTILPSKRAPNIPLPTSAISLESSLALAVTDPQSAPSPRRSQLPLSSQSPSSSSRLSLPTQSPQSSRPSPPPAPTPVPSSTSTSAPGPTPAPTPTPASFTPTSQPHAGASKAWPHGKCVAEIAAGFREMDELMKDPAIKQADAFKRVFRVPYKKSTVCNHRKWWRDAPAELIDEWARLGRDERATWSEFVRVLEGKEPRRAVLGLGLGAAGAGAGSGGGGAKGAGVGAGFVAAMSPQAFGSPQGGVLSLGSPMQMPITMQVQGIAAAAAMAAGVAGGSSPAEDDPQRFLG